MVQYPFDTLTVLSNVEGLTTNGKPKIYDLYHPFALRYRRANANFCEELKFQRPKEL